MSVYQLRGTKRVAAALRDGTPVGLVLVKRASDDEGVDAVVALARERSVPVREVTPAVIRRMTSVGPAADVLALVGRDPGADLAAVIARRGALWLLVDTAYPSNAGMVIRTAEGSGADGIVIDADWDHAGRRTALRTSMRADWYLPVLWESAETAIDRAREAGHRIFGIENRGDVAPWEADLTGPSAFVVGGEARGIPPAILERCDQVLRIPMGGFIPSYNLQAAVAVVSVERLRQLGK